MVVLNGVGGDEVFGHHDHYFYIFFIINKREKKTQTVNYFIGQRIKKEIRNSCILSLIISIQKKKG